MEEKGTLKDGTAFVVGGEPSWTLQELADALTNGKLGAMARWLNDVLEIDLPEIDLDPELRVGYGNLKLFGSELEDDGHYKREVRAISELLDD